MADKNVSQMSPAELRQYMADKRKADANASDQAAIDKLGTCSNCGGTGKEPAAAPPPKSQPNRSGFAIDAADNVKKSRSQLERAMSDQ